MISKSPERNTFQAASTIKKLEEDPTDENARAMVEMYKTMKIDLEKQEQDPDWQKDNLEYDLRTTDWILEKVRGSDAYAQNLYAAMCNNDFTKREMWPLLKEQRWSCSWRHAGGIIADMQEKGDYIDWYCSGIRDTFHNEDDTKNYTKEQLDRLEVTKKYASESQVTEEIEADLYTLGWIVVKYTGE